MFLPNKSIKYYYFYPAEEKELTIENADKVTMKITQEATYWEENNNTTSSTPPATSSSKNSTNTSSSTGTSSTSSSSTYTQSTSTSTSSSSTSTYSTPTYSNYNYSRSKSFNSPSYGYERFGFSAGYVQKQWVNKGGSETIKNGAWEDSKYMSGVQVGFRFEPLFKYGFGISTGLFYEYYYSKSSEFAYDDGYCKGTLQEHVAYLPVHLEYRLHFSDDFQLFFYGGVGLDYGIAADCVFNDTYDDYELYHSTNFYDSEDAPDWKRFNASVEYGGGIRFKMVQLNFTMANGLIDMSSSKDYTTKQGKPLMVSLSVMF